MMSAIPVIDIRQLWPGETPFDGALAFIDLATAPEDTGDIALPLCPVIGLGDATHPLAHKLDAVLQAPVTATALAAHVSAHPYAAAVTVALLRAIPHLPILDALAAESMAYGLLQGSAEHLRWRAGRASQPPTAAGQIEVERIDNRLVITLANPASGNAVDRTMRDELAEAFTLAVLDTSIAEVLLRAEGRTFSLGAELGEFGTTTDPATAFAIRAQTLPAHALARCADRLTVHVHGGCVGSGLEMAAWGQRVTATPQAWFQLPELAMGVLPGAGGCVALIRRIGRQRTALLVLSGKRLNARQALDWGLIDAIVDEPPGNHGGADVVR